MDKVCTGCGRFESDDPIGGAFLSCCPDSDYQEINVNMKDLIVFYKSQTKELEGLRERLKDGEFIWDEAMKHDGGCDCGNVTGEGITDACKKLLSQDTTQPGKGGE